MHSFQESISLVQNKLLFKVVTKMSLELELEIETKKMMVPLTSNSRLFLELLMKEILRKKMVFCQVKVILR